MVNKLGSRRTGASTVEFALVGTVLAVLLFGLLILGLGVFRYQQVASLAREGARWVSVRGPQYQSETGTAAPTSSDVKTAITDMFFAMDSSDVTVTLTFNTSKTIATVQVSYQWLPEALLGGMTLSSTAKIPVCY
jgi:Flp pilus assembly protein TadG